jgi:hypothetical protein
MVEKRYLSFYFLRFFCIYLAMPISDRTCDREQWDFQNNRKTMEQSHHWIMTGWHGEQWDFRNNEKTMERFDHWMSGSWQDGMENSEIFKTMKRQWNILITGSWLDGMENSEIFKTMKRQWNILMLYVNNEFECFIRGSKHEKTVWNTSAKRECFIVFECLVPWW